MLTDKDFQRLTELARGTYDESAPGKFGGTGAWVQNDQQFLAEVLLDVVKWADEVRS